MTLPAMCALHRAVYATRAKTLEGTRHPDAVDALTQEARTVAGQCPRCPRQEDQ